MRVEVYKKHRVFLKCRQQQDSFLRKEKEEMNKQEKKIKKMWKA